MPSLKKMTDEDFLKNDPLREFHVWWDDISDQEVTELETVLESADGEEQLQQVLTRIPVLLVQNMKATVFRVKKNFRLVMHSTESDSLP